MTTPPLRDWQVKAGGALRPSPCGCIERLREFKNLTVGQFWRRLQVMDVPGLGVFGMEYPDEEEVEEALTELKESLADYTEYCPFEIGPETTALQEILDEATGEKATLEDIIEGSYDEYYSEILAKAQAFTTSAIKGILRDTKGHRFTRGPFSFSEEISNRCSDMLNNIEAASFELTNMAEMVEAGWPPPIEIVDQEIAVNEVQRDLYREYILNCKPKVHLQDMNNLEMALESFAIGREWEQRKLDKYDAWTEDQYGAGSLPPDHPDFNKWIERIEGRDHPIAQIHDDIINHQGPIKVFLEDEWLTACGPLEWIKPSIGGGGAAPGMMLQKVNK